MRIGPTGGDQRQAGIAMFMIAPVLVIFGAVVVVVLATPVAMALTAMAFGGAVLVVGAALTRQPPGIELPAKEVPMCESVDLLPLIDAETIDMVESLPDWPGAAVSASVTEVFCPCPLGLMPGNIWRIGSGGGLSRPMCRLAATALSALFRMTDGDAMDRSACCECSFTGRKVTFTVREPEKELADIPV